MLVRRATPADILPMQLLERQAHGAAHWSEREYEALFAPESPRRVALIAENELHETYGFLIARCGVDGWEIENVIVAAQHRRQGVGSQLLREILQIARQGGATGLLLEVRESNAAARQLYEKFGFAEVGRRRNYYSEPPEDALLLSLPTPDL